MNKPSFHALSRALPVAALICLISLAQAQSNAPATPAAPPPTIATQDTAGQAQLEQSMAQGRGSAPAVAPSAAVAPDAAEQSLLDRKTQKVEHLYFEDAGSRVDEIRVGGQTRRITVQPKDGAPAYEVQPANPNRPDAGIGQTGPRVWRIHQF